MEAEEQEVQAVDYETEASKDGWAPLEQWKGDPDKWKSAEKFVSDGKNINGILKSKIDRLDHRVNELLETNKQFNEFTQRSLKKEKQENERLILELENVRKQAVTDGDGSAFATADRQIQELRQDNQPAQPQMDPNAAKWLGENQWYKTDRTLATYADGLSDQLRSQGYSDQSPAYYDELTRQVKETFPDRFENPNRKRPNGVEAGGEQVVASKNHTFDSLPKEAKAAYAQFKRDIPDFTKEQYVEQYDWE